MKLVSTISVQSLYLCPQFGLLFILYYTKQNKMMCFEAMQLRIANPRPNHALGVALEH
jgi:hypothetical protein